MISLAAAVTGLSLPSVLLPGTSWALSLDVGRHKDVGTWMPEEWAASGTRLVISGIEVEFADEITDIDEPRLNGLGDQEEAYRLHVLSSGKFTVNGESFEVETASGAWSRVSKTPKGGSPEYRLRFFLEFPESAISGDVELPAGKIFFTTDAQVAQVGMASGFGVSKSGQLNVKRVRTLIDALKNIGRSPKLQWGEGMFTVGLFTMTPTTAAGDA